MKFQLTPHILDQQNVLFHGRRVGYCGDKAGMPICFLIEDQCKLNDDEKREVVAFVIKQLGSAKITPQTAAYFPTIPEGGNDEQSVDDSGDSRGE